MDVGITREMKSYLSRCISFLLFLAYRNIFAAEYLLIDLQPTNTANIGRWVTSENMLPQWSDEYKSRYLVLRKIEVQEISNRTPSLIANLAPTNFFYIGVFEVTQRQWELVIGDRPSYFRNDNMYKTRPVERVDYVMVRGNNDVEENSFLGKLRAITGLNGIDLPTEKQWEYACRAGTETPFHNGRILPHGWESIPGDWCNDVARTYENTPNAYLWKPGKGQNKVFWGFGYYEKKFPMARPSYTGTQIVGMYEPNQFGLYDMHGNVAELCKDYFSKELNQIATRGGCWIYTPEYCTSSYRSRNRKDVVSSHPVVGPVSESNHDVNNHVGFRIVLNETL